MNRRRQLGAIPNIYIHNPRLSRPFYLLQS